MHYAVVTVQDIVHTAVFKWKTVHSQLVRFVDTVHSLVARLEDIVHSVVVRMDDVVHSAVARMHDIVHFPVTRLEDSALPSGHGAMNSALRCKSRWKT